MPKSLPHLKSDAAAARFLDTADLSNYDLSGGRIVRYELKAKDTTISLRLPGQLLEAARARAKQEGVPVQRLIRLALEQALAQVRKTKIAAERPGRRARP